MPDTIWVRQPNHVAWMDIEPEAPYWTKYVRADVVQNAIYQAMDGVAARYEQATAPALSDEDAQFLELVRLARQINRYALITLYSDNTVSIRPHRDFSASGPIGEVVAKMRARLAPKTLQPPTYEEAVELLADAYANRIYPVAPVWDDIRKFLQRDTAPFSAPKPPQRPTAEVLMLRIKDYLRGGLGDKELLTEMVKAWDAAEKAEAEHAE